MVSKEDKHTKHRPTKEKFYAATYYSADQSLKGSKSGPLIDADDETGNTNVYVPKDFDELEELVVVVLPIVTLAAMTVNVATDYCLNGQPYNNHSDGIGTLTFNAPGEDVIEVDIKAAVNVAPLEPGDYLGVTLTRLAGQNANLIYIGVRIKYRYK